MLSEFKGSPQQKQAKSGRSTGPQAAPVTQPGVQLSATSVVAQRPYAPGAILPVSVREHAVSKSPSPTRERATSRAPLPAREQAASKSPLPASRRSVAPQARPSYRSSAGSLSPKDQSPTSPLRQPSDEEPSKAESASKIQGKDVSPLHTARRPQKRLSIPPQLSHLNDYQPVHALPTAEYIDAANIALEMSKWPLLMGCEKEVLDELAHAAVPRLKDLDMGQEAVHRGHPNTAMIWVRKGALTIVCSDLEVLKLLPGHYIGEAAMLGFEQHWPVTLRAERPSKVGFLAREDFAQAVEDFESAKEHFQAVGFTSDVELFGCLSRVLFFYGLSEKALAGLDSNMITRVIMPGEKIVNQGDPGEEMYLLMHGEMTVEINNICVNTVEVKQGDAPICIGELTFIGKVPLRTATVKAVNMCVVRVLCRAVFLQQMHLFAESLRVDPRSKEEVGVYNDEFRATWVREVKIFVETGCSEGFVDYLSRNLEPRIYIEGQAIIEEDGHSDSRSMYMLSDGNVYVKTKGKTIDTIGPGAIFGELMAFGIVSKRTASVIAAELCYVETLHLGVILQGLQRFPEQRPKVLEAARHMVTQSKATKRHAVPFEHTFGNTGMHAILQKSPIFEHTNKELLDRLARAAEERSFFPDEMVVTEGEKGRSMFIVVSGKAGMWVSKREARGRPPNDEDAESPKFDRTNMTRLQHLSTGDVFGELAMLGVSSRRSASVRAESLCTFWELTQERAFDILMEYPIVQHRFANMITDHLEQSVLARISSLKLFSGFDARFRMQMNLVCKRSLYFPKQVLAREEKPSQGLYVINAGTVKVRKKDVDIMTLGQGDYFGAAVMLGIYTANLATLQAAEVCHALIITKEDFNTVHAKYPAPETVAALKRTEQAAHDELAREIEALVKTHAMKALFHAAVAPYLIDDSRRGKLSKMSSVFRAWRTLAMTEVQHRRRVLDNRRRQQQSWDVYEGWIVRQYMAREKRQLKEEMSSGAELPRAMHPRHFAWTHCEPIKAGRPEWQRLPSLSARAPSAPSAQQRRFLADSQRAVSARPGTSGALSSPSASSSPSKRRSVFASSQGGSTVRNIARLRRPFAPLLRALD